MPPGVVNWNDQDNNNSFHSKEIVLCFNGSLSIELAQIDKKEQYEDQFTRGLPLGNDSKPLPAQMVEFGLVIPKGAKNVDVAKELLKYAIEPKVLNEYLKGVWPLGDPLSRTGQDRPVLAQFRRPASHRLHHGNLRRSDDPCLRRHTAPRPLQVDLEHVFQNAWNDVVTNGMAPEAAADKALRLSAKDFC